MISELKASVAALREAGEELFYSLDQENYHQSVDEAIIQVVESVGNMEDDEIRDWLEKPVTLYIEKMNYQSYVDELADMFEAKGWIPVEDVCGYDKAFREAAQSFLEQVWVPFNGGWSSRPCTDEETEVIRDGIREELKNYED